MAVDYITISACHKPKCPSVEEWIKKIWRTYVIKDYAEVINV